MFLSKRSNGYYYLWFIDENGHKQKTSTKCKLKSDALKFLQQFKEGEKERKAKLKRASLSQFVEEFLGYSQSVHAVNTQELFKYTFREFVRIVGNLPLCKVGIREVENFLAVKKNESSDWTAKKYYLTLASAFETAKRWNYIASNPFRQVEKPKVRELQPAYFSKTEFQSLLQLITNRDFRELCVCAVFTGVRLSELTALQWTDIDFVRKVISVQNSESFTTKSKKNRVVPMSEQLWKMLAVRKEAATCELVFHSGGQRLKLETVSKTFKRHVRLAGLGEGLHFHSLRHTFASWLVQEGVSLYEVQKLLGHSVISVTQVYAHLQPERLHSAVNRISIPLN
jgi:integrase